MREKRERKKLQQWKVRKRGGGGGNKASKKKLKILFNTELKKKIKKINE